MALLKKVILIVVFLIALLVVIWGALFYFVIYKPTIVLAGHKYLVEIADTNKEREKGLSGHKPLKDNEGMLFIFPQEDNYGFWMKDMLFPIDIVWINKNLQVVHIERNVATSTYPNVFTPESLSMYVLELQSGESQKIDLKVGDTIKLF
jgi:uncharacterized membrane protein (UPF0127 family)